MDKKSFSRADSSLLSQWWWTVDRIMLFSIGCILAMGLILSMTASPSVAKHIGLSPFYFFKRHLMILPVVCVLIFLGSLMSQEWIRKISLVLLATSIIFMMVVLIGGDEVKGARRWMSVWGFSLQPSEFAKPALAIVSAWFLCLQNKHKDFPGYWMAGGIFACVLTLLALQPDMGMVGLIVASGLAQLFVGGISLVWIWGLGGIGLAGLILAYYAFPHVAQRINLFINPGGGDPYGESYQINKALEAFMSGGLTGQGPGEGVIKKYIPDVHADFVFAVAGEEFGLIFCLFMVWAFALFVMRSFTRVWQHHHLFPMIAVTGLATQFGLQSIINLSSTLRLMPTKGMTLPFVSYGGSSMLASAITVGFILAFTKKKDH